MEGNQNLKDNQMNGTFPLFFMFPKSQPELKGNPNYGTAHQGQTGRHIHKTIFSFWLEYEWDGGGGFHMGLREYEKSPGSFLFLPFSFSSSSR